MTLLAFMSDLTYIVRGDEPTRETLVWLRGEIKTPPFTAEARVEAGHLLRLVQLGWKLGMPRSRPMPTIGPKCHELGSRMLGVTGGSCTESIRMRWS